MKWCSSSPAYNFVFLRNSFIVHQSLRTSFSSSGRRRCEIYEYFSIFFSLLHSHRCANVVLTLFDARIFVLICLPHICTIFGVRLSGLSSIENESRKSFERKIALCVDMQDPERLFKAKLNYFTVISTGSAKASDFLRFIFPLVQSSSRFLGKRVCRRQRLWCFFCYVANNHNALNSRHSLDGRGRTYINFKFEM